MLKIKSTQIGRMSMSSYVGYIRHKHIIAYNIVERDSNQNRAVGSRQQQHDSVCTLHFEYLSKRDTKAGSCTLVRMLTRMSCNPYATWFPDVKSCVFESFVIFAIFKNY